MKKILIGCLFFVTLASCNHPKSDFSQYVNPFIGNADNGHTFPGAAMPFGMIQASPETGNNSWRYCSGYNYEDSVILGFSQTHLNGTGCSDLGDVLMLPFSGNTDKEDFSSVFDKQTEQASPGFYKVTLMDGVEVELTATEHTAMHKYTFNKGNAHVLLDLQSGVCWDDHSKATHVLSADIDVKDNYTIEGHHRLSVWVTRDLFYTVEFNKPFTVNRELEMAETEKAKRYLLDFDLKPGETLLAKVVLSSVSIDGAKLNMKTENPGWDFEAIRIRASAAWNKLLSRAIVEGTTDQKVAFYTSLYHLFIQPNNMADVDGKYRGANDSVATSPSNAYYSTLSLWDTYRAANPLYTILAPEKVGDFVTGMIAHFDAVDVLPIWTLWGKENYCMIANHSVPVIVDAYLKGFKGFDAEKAYEAIKSNLTKDHLNSPWSIYDQYGYFPFDKVRVESVSKTLECCYDDYAAAQMAKALGKEDDYEFFINRSNNYKNLFDVETKFMRGRDSAGNWRTPFDPFDLSHAGSAGGDYTEGNAWQYTWHVQQDAEGLAELFGGNEQLTAKLDSLFKLEPIKKGAGSMLDVSGLIGQYAHGNEPSHHVAYLFAMLGKPERTQELVREIVDQFYLPKPDGLCGNDDCGQMSAWYIFSAMGFYPVNPVSGEFVFGAPQLPKITLSLPQNKTFMVEARNLSESNKYVKNILLNGQSYTKNYITYRDIMNGGTLVFEMSDK